MAENRQYDHEYKVQAVKLAKEIGQAKAAKELGVPKNTMYGWVRANRLGNLDLGAGSQTPQSAMTLNEELILLRQQVKEPENVDIPSERTVYRIMEEIGISHHPRRKPNGITKADREARKSDDLLKRDFHAEEPLTKCVTDITEIKASDGKLYVSAVFDCFDSSVTGLAMDTNMKAPLCVQTLENTAKAYPGIRGAIIHSDRGEPVHQPALQGCSPAVWHTAKYEQRRRQMPR